MTHNYLRGNRMSTLFLLVILIASIQGIDWHSHIQVQPMSQEVSLNSTVNFECRTRGNTPEDKEVLWIKDEFGIGSTREDIQNFGKRKQGEPPRFDMPNNLFVGHYDLQIRQVRLADEGSYKCQVRIGDKTSQSQYANLTVLVPSQTPELYQYSNKTGDLLGKRDKNTHITIVDGEILVLKCLAKNGKPGADLTWSLNDAPVDKNHFPTLYSVEKKEASESFDIIFHSWSMIYIPMNKMRHGNIITCKAHNRGYYMYARPSVEAPIEVNYGPDVTISVIPSRSDFLFNDGEIVQFQCSASGRPDQFSWKWKINEKTMPNANSPLYQLVMTRDLHNSTVTCIAESFREGQNSRKIFARFGPEFDNDRVSLYPTTIGSNERLSCNVSGNPVPRIEWRRENQPHVIATGPYLERLDVRRSDLGTYICTAHVNGFKPKSKRMFLLLKQAPMILPGPLFRGSLSHEMVLKCEVKAVPPLIEEQTVWTLNGRRITRDSLHSFEQEISKEGTVLVKLIIRKLRVNDFGEYNCTVWNSLGTDTQVVKLIIEDSIPLNFIISLCVVTLIAFTLVILFYFICKHRRSKKEYEKSNLANISKNFDKNPFTSTLLGASTKSPNLPCHYMSQNGGHEYPTNYSEWSYVPDKGQSQYIDPFINHCGLDYDDGISIANSHKYSQHNLSIGRNEIPSTDQIYRIATPSQNISYTGVLLNACSPNFDRKSFSNQQVYGYVTNGHENGQLPINTYADPTSSTIGSAVQISNFSTSLPRKDFLSQDYNKIGEHATNV